MPQTFKSAEEATKKAAELLASGKWDDAVAVKVDGGYEVHIKRPSDGLSETNWPDVDANTK